MLDLGDLAVHRQWRPRDLAAEGLTDGLQAEADAEDRDLAARLAGPASRHTPASLGVQGPGERTIASGRTATISAAVIGVVAHDIDLRDERPDQMHQVPGEAVVVVDDEDAGHGA